MDTHLDPIWEGAVVDRFRQSVGRFVRERFASDFPMGTQTPEDEELQVAVVNWFCAHSENFVRYVHHVNHYPDEMSFIGDGHWRVNWEAIGEQMWTVAYDCRRELDLREDAARFPNLDAWLTALHARELRASAPFEPNATDFMDAEDGRWFADRARDRRRNWPRACRGCGTELSRERLAPAVLWCEQCWQGRIPA
jgi:hypothetical protein